MPGPHRLLAKAAHGIPRGLRRPVALALAALAIAAAAFGWLRDSSLVAVEQATVTGLSTAQAPRVREALIAAARDMTTLHVRTDQLEQAVAPYPEVASVTASADFPHGLRIYVTEHRPVALLPERGGGGTVPVAADGTIVRGLAIEEPLPLLDAVTAPAADRLADARGLQALEIIVAAPAALARRIRTVDLRDPRGAVARLRRGPEVVLGQPVRLRVKWSAAAAVLADRSSRGAGYVDVRVPERPAAGGVGPPPDSPEPATDPPGAAEPGAPGDAPEASPTPGNPASQSPAPDPQP